MLGTIQERIGTENGWIAIGEGAEADSTITTKEKVAEDPSKGYVAGAGIAIGYYSKASGASSTALGGYSLAESIGSSGARGRCTYHFYG